MTIGTGWRYVGTIVDDNMVLIGVDDNMVFPVGEMWVEEIVGTVNGNGVFSNGGMKGEVITGVIGGNGLTKELRGRG